MYNKTAKEKVIEWLEALNYVNNINRGGCLYVCYAIFEKLKAEGLSDRGIGLVQLQYNWAFTDRSIEHNKKWLKGENAEAESGNHFAIKIDGKIYDTTGEITDKEFFLFSLPKKQRETFIESSLRYGDWNESFNRRYGVKRINEILNLNLPLYV